MRAALNGMCRDLQVACKLGLLHALCRDALGCSFFSVSFLFFFLLLPSLEQMAKRVGSLRTVDGEHVTMFPMALALAVSRAP